MKQYCYICGDEFWYDTIWITCGASCEEEFQHQMREEE